MSLRLWQSRSLPTVAGVGVNRNTGGGGVSDLIVVIVDTLNYGFILAVSDKSH